MRDRQWKLAPCRLWAQRPSISWLLLPGTKIPSAHKHPGWQRGWYHTPLPASQGSERSRECETTAEPLLWPPLPSERPGPAPHLGAAHADDAVDVACGIVEVGDGQGVLAGRDPVPFGGRVDLEHVGPGAEDGLLPARDVSRAVRAGAAVRRLQSAMAPAPPSAERVASLLPPPSPSSAE